MADFKAGDRVVKMSGAGAGKYGTVNSVAENGTLNVTFDGERLPRYCDPMRCGQVAANALDDFRHKPVETREGQISRLQNYIVFNPQDAKSKDELVDKAVAWMRTKWGVSVLKSLAEDAYRQMASKGLVRLPSNAVRNERIRAYPDGPGEWILVDAVGDEGIGRTTATDERGVKAQLADIAVRTYRWHRPEIVIMREKYSSNAARKAIARNAVARNAGRFELVEHNMGRSFGVYDSATSGYIADDIPLRDALRILKTKGETAEQAKKDLDWTDPAAIDRLW